VCEWVDQLCETLEMIRELARKRQLLVTKTRKKVYDKNKKKRKLKQSNLVQKLICNYKVRGWTI